MGIAPYLVAFTYDPQQFHFTSFQTQASEPPNIAIPYPRVDLAPVPEPASAAVLLCGAALLLRRRRKIAPLIP